MVQAVKTLRAAFPSLVVMCDVCLCAYTSHGHCGVSPRRTPTSRYTACLIAARLACALFHTGILNEDGSIDNARSIERLGQVALRYAQAGMTARRRR